MYIFWEAGTHGFSKGLQRSLYLIFPPSLCPPIFLPSKHPILVSPYLFITLYSSPPSLKGPSLYYVPNLYDYLD